MYIYAFVTPILCFDFLLRISAPHGWISWSQHPAATWQGWSDTFPGLASPTPPFPGHGATNLDEVTTFQIVCTTDILSDMNTG